MTKPTDAQHDTRREWWIADPEVAKWPRSKDELRGCHYENGAVHVREVLPGEVTITRKEFRQAFGAAFCEPGNTHKEMDSTLGLAVEKMLFDGIRPEGPCRSGESK